MHHILFASQVLLDGGVTTLLLEGLRPQTEYTVSVYSLIGEQRSEPLSGVDLTCEQTSPSIAFAGPLWIHVSTTQAFPKHEGKVPLFPPPGPETSEPSSRHVIFPLGSERPGAWPPADKKGWGLGLLQTTKAGVWLLVDNKDWGRGFL